MNKQNKLSNIEKSRNPLLSAVEITICIDELKQDIKTQENWLNNIDTIIKIQSNSVNTFCSPPKSIHEYVKESKDFIKHAKRRISDLSMENLTYLN